MMKSFRKIFFITAVITFVAFSGCEKENIEPEPEENGDNNGGENNYNSAISAEGEISATVENGATLVDIIDYVKASIKGSEYYEVGLGQFKDGGFTLQMGEVPDKYLYPITDELEDLDNLQISDRSAKISNSDGAFIEAFRGSKQVGLFARIKGAFTDFDDLEEFWDMGGTLGIFIYCNKAVKVSGEIIGDDEYDNITYLHDYQLRQGWNELVAQGKRINNELQVSVTANNEPEGMKWVFVTEKTIWEDTHWRLCQLKGRPESTETGNGSNFMAFNPEGKVSFYYGQTYEYDTQGRLIRISDDYSAMEIEYGDHTKYLPGITTFGFVNFCHVDYLLRGVSAIVVTEEGKRNRMAFTVSGDKITGRHQSPYKQTDYEATYSGDYPVTYYKKEVRDEGTDYQTTEENTKYYKYGEDFRYSEIIRSWSYTYINYEEMNRSSSSKETYKLDGAPYLLLETIAISHDNGHTYTPDTQYEYDDLGRMTKVTEQSSSGDEVWTISFSNYEEDDRMNWIRRSRTENDGSPETDSRKITYYD